MLLKHLKWTQTKENYHHSLLSAFLLLPLLRQELSHWSITMKNAEIRTVAISLPNFQAIRITDLF